MTIAAGFVGKDGVLICSDSEHSAGGLLTHESKLTPAEFEWGKVVFASAGNAELAVAAIEKCICELESRGSRIKSRLDVVNIIESTVNAEYRKHVCPEPNPDSNSVYEILVAIWCEKDKRKQAVLYRTWQGVILGVSGHHCIGSGYYLGRYVSVHGWGLLIRQHFGH